MKTRASGPLEISKVCPYHEALHFPEFCLGAWTLWEAPSGIPCCEVMFFWLEGAVRIFDYWEKQGWARLILGQTGFLSPVESMANNRFATVLVSKRLIVASMNILAYCAEHTNIQGCLYWGFWLDLYKDTSKKPNMFWHSRLWFLIMFCACIQRFALGPSPVWENMSEKSNTEVVQSTVEFLHEGELL